jgi:hypothetical protein
MSNKHSSENVMVKVIDPQKVMDLLGLPKVKDGEQYRIVIEGVIDNKICTTKDCLYSFLKKIFINGQVRIVIDIPIFIDITKNGIQARRPPQFYAPVDVESDIYSQEVSLKEYMGDRYNYNSRIMTNMFNLLKAI